MTPQLAGAVAVVADEQRARPVLDALAAADPGLEVASVQPSRRAAFDPAYRAAAVAVLTDPLAIDGARVVRRLSRIPWLAYIDERMLDVAVRSNGRALAGAAAVLCPASLAARAQAVLRETRFVDPGESERVRAVIGDVALAAGGRADSTGGRWAIVADTWTFVNDRATRLAIRLVAVTGKAAAPIHPHHLIDLPSHFWYRPYLHGGDRLLDVGCADGSHTLAAARLVREAVGVDIDAAHLARAEQRAGSEGIENARFVRGDLTDERTLDELGREPFDVVIVLDVLEHLVERESLLRAIRGLLRPRGSVVVSVPSRDTPYRRWLRRLGGFAYSDPDHKVEYTEESLAGELAASGFRVDSIERGGYDSPFGGLGTLVAPFSLRAYARLARRRHRLATVRPGSATALRAVASPAETATASA